MCTTIIIIKALQLFNNNLVAGIFDLKLSSKTQFSFNLKDNSIVSLQHTHCTRKNKKKQAGRSIFKNKDLLSDISAVPPFYIGGIDGGFRGLCIQEDGDFRDLGHVGLTSSAIANILSKTRFIDAGNDDSYDAHADVHHFHGAQRSYTYGRKMNGLLIWCSQWKFIVKEEHITCLYWFWLKYHFFFWRKHITVIVAIAIAITITIAITNFLPLNKNQF